VSTRVYIRLFGPFQLEGLESPTPLSRHAVGLLGYLGESLGVPKQRSELASLLWCSVSESKARHSLSQLVYHLKGVLPHGILEATATTVALSPAVADVDVIDFRNAIERDDPDAAVDLYVGGFLDGASYLSDEYDDWRVATAALLEIQAKAARAQLISEALEAEDHLRAAALAKSGLLITPHDERLARTRVECLASAGDVGKALRELEVLRKQFLVVTGQVSTLLSDDFARQLATLPALPDGRISASGQVRMVGRGQQVKLLREHWNAARRECRVAMLYGEAGIGKTRLLQHIARRTVLEGARTFMYSCSEAERRLPYSAIVGLIRDGFRPTDLDLLGAQWRTPMASFAPELFSHDQEISIVQERILWEAVAQYFDAVAQRQPITVSLDDFQWADDYSQELLVYVTRRLSERPLFVLCAGRVPPRTFVCEDERSITALIEVPQLTGAEVEELITEFEHSHNVVVRSGHREMMLSRIGGRPFFLLEVLRQLRTQGDLEDNDQLLHLITSGDLTKHVASRLHSVGTEARSLAVAAAVLSREIPLYFLARVTELSPIAAAAAASNLIEQGIFADAEHIRFNHDLMREAVARALPAAEARFWHARVASALSANDSGAAGEIAYHYEAAGDYVLAFTYARRAAEEALRLNAYADADEQYGRALRCAPNVALDNLYVDLTRFVTRSARYERLLEVLPAVHAVAQRTNDPEALLVCELAFLASQEKGGYSDHNELATRAKHIVSMAENHGPDRLATVMWQVAEHIKRSGDTSLLNRFAEVLETRGLESQGAAAADMLSAAAMLFAPTRGYARGLPLADRAVDRGEESTDQVVLARALFSRGTLRLWSGRLRDAARDYDEALAAVDRFAPDGLVQSIQANYAVVLLEQGRFDEAEHHAKAALNEPRATRRAYSYGNLALISLQRGDRLNARRHIESLLSIHAFTPQSWIPVHAAAMLGLADLQDGDISSAAIRAATVEARIDAAAEATDSCHIHLLRARVAHLQGHTDSALAVLRDAAAAAEGIDAIAAARLHLEAIRLLSPNLSIDVRSTLSEIAVRCTAGGASLLASEAEQLLNEAAP
jgi:DNA-binding SARP family transcriptional activator/tetratricopeptide (TPR) repeat protein